MLLFSTLFSLAQSAGAQGGWTWVEPSILAGISGTLVTIGAAVRQVQKKNELAAQRDRLAAQQKALLDENERVKKDAARAAMQVETTTKQAYLQLDQAEDRVATLEQVNLGLQSKNTSLEKDKKELLGQAEGLGKDIQEIKRANPTFQRVVYNVGVIGIASSGKSVIVLKLVDPSFQEFNTIKPTDVVELYDRTVVVQQHPKDFRRQQHVFRFREWGGEHLVRAQTDMLNLSQASARVEKENLLELDGMHGIVFVVDLGLHPDGTPVEQRPTTAHVLLEGRIREQYTKYFNENAIKFLLNDKVLNSCRSVVLFINKCDLIEKFPPEEIERIAEEYYRELIMLLRTKFPELVVIAGSANTEAGLHKLYSTLVSRVLSNLRGVENIGIANKYRRTKSAERAERTERAENIPVHSAAESGPIASEELDPVIIDPTLDPARNSPDSRPNAG